MVHLSLSGDTPEQIDQWCVKRLRMRGYLVMQKWTWERPGQLCERLGISRDTLERRMASRWCPEVKQERGPTGRLIAVASNPAADEFFAVKVRRPQDCRGFRRFVGKKGGRGASQRHPRR